MSKSNLLSNIFLNDITHDTYMYSLLIVPFIH